jgi:hypothetical protein
MEIASDNNTGKTNHKRVKISFLFNLFSFKDSIKNGIADKNRINP